MSSVPVSKDVTLPLLPPPPPPPPIIPTKLKVDTALQNWLKGSIIIGEARSLDHLSTFHEHLENDIKTKYLGGLRLALEFRYSKDAVVFLKNEIKWKDWFSWVKSGDIYQSVQNYERTAWLNITGLPLELWDEENFSRIAGSFGKVINPFDYIHGRSDWSKGKVGIITCRRTWINEEIIVEAAGKMYRVGVVESTDDWSPFRSLPFDKTISDEDEGDEDDDSDAISDTWANMEADEPEEGEIRPVNDKVNSAVNSPAIPPPNKPAEVPTDEPRSPMVGCRIEEEEACILGDKTPTLEQTTREKNQNGPEGRNWVGHETNGLLKDLVPLGCFGPFPANFNNKGSSGNSRKGRKSKRRRADSEGRSYSPMIQSLLSPVNNCRSDSIDLNANPAISDHGVAQESSVEDGGEVSVSPVVDEIRETIAVGNEIGFQIEEGNVLISKVVEGDGVQINNQ
ncbi:hypothetical protein L1887_34430 [Cichorium endivia]|nr:hypothetical protein L1887_34430 [Cichorium endivia]